MKKRLAFIIVGIFVVLLIGSGILLWNFKNGSNQISEFGVNPLISKITDRAYIDELRHTDSSENIIIGNETFTKDYTSIDRGLVIRNGQGDLLLDMKLVSDYSVTGLVASSDTKVAEFLLGDWDSKRTILFDDISFFDVKKGHKEISRTFTYKYGIEIENCEFDCYNYTEWVEFNSLSELPHKNIKIGAFTNTQPLEHVEFVPVISGFQILQWAEWDVSTASHAEVMTTGGTLTSDLFFSSDGSKMYVSDSTLDMIRQWTLSTPYNITTALNDYNLTITVKEPYPRGLYFKPDGTSMYTSTGSGNEEINRWDLDAWDLSSAVWHSEVIILGEQQDAFSFLSFKSDGTRMYIGGNTPNIVGEYDLGVAWSLTDGVTWSRSFNQSEDNNLQGGYFREDGLKLYLVGFTNKRAYEYNLTEAWNTRTVVYDSFLDTSSWEPSTANGIWWNSVGTMMYLTGGSKDVNQFTIEPASDTTPPNVTIYSPQNISYNIPINFTVESLDVKMGNGECWVTVNASKTNHTMLNTSDNPTFFNFSAPFKYATGGYLANFSCNDSKGNLNYSESVSFKVSDLIINIVSPLNNTNTSDNQLNINYTYATAISCKYSNDTYLKNTTITCGTNITDIIWTDAKHNFTIWGIDGGGDETSSRVSFTVNTTPNIQFIAPTPNNDTNTSSTSFIANVSLTETSFLNLTFFLYNSTEEYDKTTFTGGTRFINWSSLPDGNYTYNATVWTTTGNKNTTVSRTLKIDSSKPKVNITFLEIDYQGINTNLTINYSASDTHLESCWGSFDGGTNNITLTCANNNLTINITSINNNTFTFWANDSVDNVGVISRTWDYKVFQYYPIFNLATSEGATELFKMNFTQGGGLQTSSVNLIYNFTSYPSTFSISSDNVSVISSIIIPNLNSSSIIPFYWNIIMSDGSKINTTSYNQTGSILELDDCSTYGNLIYNFTVFDEETKSQLENTTIEVQLRIFDSLGTTRILNFSQLFEEVNPARICMNSSLLITVNYSANLVVKYTSNDSGSPYAKEYYNLLNQEISNTTIPKLIDLYSLLNSDSTEFQLTYKDSSLAFAPNILVYLYRQYVADNDFKIVEIPLTDSNGQTVLHMVRNDVVYNLVMVDASGTILATFNKMIAFCQDYTIGNCEINLNAVSDVDVIYDYTDDLGISYSTPTYSNATKLVSFNFVSNDLSIKTVSTKIIKDTNFGNRTVCENSLTSSTGIITCNISSIASTDRFLFVEIYVDGDLKVQSTIDLEADTFGFGIVEGAFFGFLIILFFITMFMEDKQILIISLVIGWAVIIALGLVKGALMGAASGGIWLIVCAVIFLWKLKKEEVG